MFHVLFGQNLPCKIIFTLVFVIILSLEETPDIIFPKKNLCCHVVCNVNTFNRNRCWEHIHWNINRQVEICCFGRRTNMKINIISWQFNYEFLCMSVLYFYKHRASGKKMQGSHYGCLMANFWILLGWVFMRFNNHCMNIRQARRASSSEEHFVI